MKNPKEIEKKSEKEIEKKREKEIFKDKIEKLEKPELKEKPEKREIKEWKEIKEKERKEFKEPFKEKVEVKEIKEFDKQIPEKGGKELVETIDPTEGFKTRAAAADFSTSDVAKPKEDEIAKPKETDKAFKEIEKIKPEKENPEKIQKEIEKIKPEKEHVEKVQKDIEKIKPEKEFSKHEIEKIKPEKEFSKHEIKEVKEFPEKHHQKDFLPDKHVFENDPKGIVENPGTFPGREPIDKGAIFTASTSEDRLNQLEEAVAKLSHFIGVDLRPDLSTGALRSEEDQAAKPEEKTDDKSKKK